MRQSYARKGKHHVDLTGEHVLNRRRGTAIGNELNPRPGNVLEPEAGKVGAASY
jgi:hypothetical protein